MLTWKMENEKYWTLWRLACVSIHHQRFRWIHYTLISGSVIGFLNLANQIIESTMRCQMKQYTTRRHLLPLRDCIYLRQWVVGGVCREVGIPLTWNSSQDLHVYIWIKCLFALVPALILCKSMHVLWSMTTLFCKQWSCEADCFLVNSVCLWILKFA